MKKIILFTTLLVSSLIQAQQVITVFNQEQEIVNDGTYTYNIINGSGSAAKLHLLVTNVSAETINVKLKMLAVENNADQEGMAFCFGGTCFFTTPIGTTAPDIPEGVVLAPNANNGIFDYFYNNFEGTTLGQPVKYTLGLIKVDNVGNQIGEPLMTFKYVYDATAATTDFAALQQMGINVNNTVVKNTLDVTANQNAKLEVFNINGQIVKTIAITSGSQAIDFSGVASAVYIARFTTEENKTSQIRIVKN